ncbi:alpha/beta fold hydrolase [Marinoscillum furvescens]|uniref:Pimeloyl-ACP methyl ester carboxylesterase n=1 Tax=Marinoscillum furvescens DSM 4134 TaxID=1122208 RepID=A0A3D9L347_MARFU|nr:alpha/beta hydrolase [Marinoscillum furvescens]RED97081.1 pimeloyl-ACP methyl ester carboxylesterase [Marinoscillum furvescens DSM 4134]
MITKGWKIFWIASLCGVATLFLVHWLMARDQETAVLTPKTLQGAPGKFATLTFGDTHYQLAGPENAPLILLIHGGGIAGLEVWSQTTPYLLRQGYRVLSYDLYGRGYSARPEVPQSTSMLHQQLVELLQYLKIDEPFHTVALSMGSMVAMDLHRSHGELMDKIVLVDPILTGSFNPNFLLKVPGLSDLLLTAYWYPRSIRNQRKEFVSDSVFQNYARRLSFFREFDGYKKTNHSTWLNVLPQRKLNELGGINRKNVLLIYGEQDPYFQEGQRAIYRSIFPRILHRPIPNAGHMPQYEQPQLVNPLITDFFANKAPI